MRVVLMLLLLSVAVPASAEWKKISENNATIHYINSKTMKSDGNLRSAWEIQDLKEKHKDGESSRRFLVEYDCKENRTRSLSFTTHSERMAKGNIITRGDTPEAWVTVHPSSIAANFLKFVCSS